MKFSEDIIKGFNLEPVEEKEPVNVMRIEDMLQFMKSCAERIVQKSEQYIKTDDADIQMDCIDIVTAKPNDFTQVLKDIVKFMIYGCRDNYKIGAM